MTLGLWIFTILLGAIIGSFLNVLIYRGPAMWGLIDDEGKPRGSLLGPRSYCPNCRTQIPAWRLIPIVSYALQKGRCAACHGVISIRYPIVEFAGIVVAALSFWRFGLTSEAVFAAIFGWCLIALAVIDWETGYLPDWLTLPLIVVGLAANIIGAFAGLTAALIGAVAGYVTFTLIGAAFRKVRGYEGLGQGDAKLLAAVGAWGGWSLLPFVVLFGALLTLVMAFMKKSTEGKLQATTPLPFGPGLCVAAFLGIMFGSALI